MNEELNDIQFQILDSVYFVESFSSLRDEVSTSEAILVNELRLLIDKDWVQVMVFDKQKEDFIRTAIFDTDHLEDYHFLVTRNGLMKHNGR